MTAPARTLHDALSDARRRLREAGFSEPDAALDAEVLARHVLQWTRDRLIADRREAVPDDFEDRYRSLLTRRIGREPVAYLTGHREFWNLDFTVTRDVLIPRPETELIVETVLQVAHAAPAADAGIGHLADVGTGSGCLAVALAHELPRARVIAIDRSAAALDVARRNARRHAVEGRVEFVEGDLVSPLTDRPVDLIVSNPPYVPLADAAHLPPDVREYEPALALFSGADGLDAIRALLDRAPAVLRPHGWLIFEFGFGQADAIATLATSGSTWGAIALRPDLQQIPRVAMLQRR